ncbi:hypothetical protein MNBD_GAMMA13-738 [hydrothermal vent metagenome]|uniref:Histidine kinase/HSP90-like ATPase domain-containing protein n=1 Tax=hydrothermal vent metagenome TaxID=652676 RepID=A0A3B0YJB9_9ZZZZ
MDCDRHLLAMTFCSRPSRLKLLRCVLRDVADIVCLNEEDTDAVVLAVNEACMNIIQHAYAMRQDGKIELSVFRESDVLVFHLRDYAERVDPEKIKPRNLDDVRPGGLGIHLISELMDESCFLEPPVDGGNLFEMKKFINKRG